VTSSAGVRSFSNWCGRRQL